MGFEDMLRKRLHLFWFVSNIDYLMRWSRLFRKEALKEDKTSQKAVMVQDCDNLLSW